MSPHAATFGDALQALEFLLGWHPMCEWMELRFWRPDRERRGFHHAGVGDSGRILVNEIRAADERRSEEVLLGMPAKRRGGGCPVATAFWVTVEGTDQAQRLARFQPAPTLVLREGSSSRRTALWALDCALRWPGIVRGNKRIAHRLGAAKKHAEPEKLWIPAPGTCLRRDRTRPVPVVVERLDVASYAPLEVIGRLKDAPDPDAWMKRQAAAGR